MSVESQDSVRARSASVNIERRQQGAIFLLALPALAIVSFVVVVPVGWLLWNSFQDASGALTLVNYTDMLRPIYWRAFTTTVLLSGAVALGTVLLGYPLCYFMCLLPGRLAAMAIACVLLPFWTSTLVRTFAWLVILQRSGIVNRLLLGAGLIDEPLRLANTFPGTLIGLVHLMLPFLVLPLYANMVTIDPNFMRAAASCGATPTRAFWGVYFPATWPGLLAGVIVVFVTCLGFYITPAILGGGRILMWSMQMENVFKVNPNVGAVSAPGVALALATFLTLAVLRRAVRAGPKPSVT